MNESHTPQRGDRAADFSLPDSLGVPRQLSDLASQPATRALVLIFYRGYW
jgi:peroxiredoxin